MSIAPGAWQKCFFTSPTSFANPAITIGRMFSDTFAGIAPSSVPLFVRKQLTGTAVAVLLVRRIYPDQPPDPARSSDHMGDAVIPHPFAAPAPTRD